MKKDKKFYTFAVCIAAAVAVLFVLSLIGYNYYRNILKENTKIRDKYSRQLSELNDKIEYTQTKEGNIALLRNEGYVQKNENLIKLKKSTSPKVFSDGSEKNGKLSCDKHKVDGVCKFDEYCIECLKINADYENSLKNIRKNREEADKINKSKENEKKVREDSLKEHPEELEITDKK